MKIYTKGGDLGETSLFGGKRVSKAELRIDAYGTIDELNSYIGLVSDFEESIAHLDFFLEVQENLFILGSILAASPDKPTLNIPEIKEENIVKVEKQIDLLEEDLPQLQYFILPGGHTKVSQTHIARTICRRAERVTVALNSSESINPLVIQYLNRLSDYLFVYARYLGKSLQVPERSWIPKKK